MNLARTLERTLRALVAAAAVVPAAALAAVQPERGIGLPRDASVDGHRIDWLIDVCLVGVGILFVIMVVWMVYACIAHGAKHEAVYDHGTAKGQILHAAIISGLIFFVLDIALLFNFSMRDITEVFWNWQKPETSANVVRIEVNAHQWAWEARYAGPDGAFNTADDILTTNDVRVPVNTPVIVHLAASDVIHSFYLPNFRVKTDAVPGMVNPLWFQAKDLGEFDIGCAQHCGVHHYKMKGRLTVLPAEEYQAWARTASEISARAYDPEDKDAHWGWEWKRI